MYICKYKHTHASVRVCAAVCLYKTKHCARSL